MSPEGRTAVGTGGASAIGRALARRRGADHERRPAGMRRLQGRLDG